MKTLSDSFSAVLQSSLATKHTANSSVSIEHSEKWQLCPDMQVPYSKTMLCSCVGVPPHLRQGQGAKAHAKPQPSGGQ